MDYGRGRRPTVRRTAWPPSARPISASSAAAWTAVLRTGARSAGSGLAATPRDFAAAGTPRGWAGCGRRRTRFDGACATAGGVFWVRADADFLAAGRERAGFAPGGEAAAPRLDAGAFVARLALGARLRSAGAGGASALFADAGAGVKSSLSPGRAGRFELRRCGRVRGSWLRTCEERFGGIARREIPEVPSNLKLIWRFYVTVFADPPKTSVAAAASPLDTTQTSSGDVDFKKYSTILPIQWRDYA